MAGIKDISPGNYFDCDMGPMFGPSRHEEWIALVTKRAVLPPGIPADISDQFEVYVGTLKYAWLYYPLLTMGVDKLMALREELARTACERRGASKNQTKSFEKCIDYLFANALVPPERRGKWDAGRSLRNGWAHPTARTILTADMALVLLEAFVEDAHILFPPAVASAQATP